MKRYVWLFCFMVINVCLVGCSGCKVNVQTNALQKGEFSIVSYNAQEFFDGKKDGCEYSEFKKNGNWGVEAYKVRLERLCKVIRIIDADVFVFQEIENEEILQDISNFLSGDSWRQKDLWSYSVFAKEPDSAIGNAVISKYPLKELKVHGLDIQSEDEKQPSMRPVIQVKIEVGETVVSLFANHWKSKSGGEEETELWRNWQELQLANLILNCRSTEGENFRAVICGDFNRDINDFCLNENKSDEEGNVIFRGSENQIKVTTPWIDKWGNSISAEGSYFFQDEWEKIDQIFVTGKIGIKSFAPQIREEWTSEEGIPQGYKLYNGEGFSDHLPVKAVLEILE